ncbi:MAG: RNA polymerase sigma factor FliA [Pseudomonadota bacterium]
MSGAAMYSKVHAAGADELLLRHAPLVKRIACHLMNRLPDTMQLEDLIQAGMIGLLEASRNYDANQGASFETYAGIRIRGAMLDEVRRLDWTPRNVYKKARMVAAAIREIESRTGRNARDVEAAEHLGISLEDYQRVLTDSASCRLFSIEELAQQGDQHELEHHSNAMDTVPEPGDDLSRAGFKAALAEAIKALPEREMLVVSLYYDEELNMREIGEVLGVSESRVCQINTQAMLRLRAKLASWVGRENG